MSIIDGDVKIPISIDEYNARIKQYNDRILNELIEAGYKHIKHLDALDALAMRVEELEREKGGLVVQKADEYPSVPLPMLKLNKSKPKDVPSDPGVYFLWDDTSKAVLYVGQSVNLRNRMRSHHVIRDGDYISWIQFKRNRSPEGSHKLLCAEAYYIGILKPVLNFGGTRDQP